MFRMRRSYSAFSSSNGASRFAWFARSTVVLKRPYGPTEVAAAANHRHLVCHLLPPPCPNLGHFRRNRFLLGGEFAFPESLLLWREFRLGDVGHAQRNVAVVMERDAGFERRSFDSDGFGGRRVVWGFILFLSPEWHGDTPSRESFRCRTFYRTRVGL